MSPQPEPTTALFIPISFYNFTTSFSTKSNYPNVFPAIVQPNQSSNLDSLTCTSTAASIGDPSMHRVRCLGEWPSTPITVASKSDRGSSYASLSISPMTASQSHERCHLSGSHSSCRSVCLAPSSLSSPHSSLVLVVGGSGSRSSSSSSSDVGGVGGPTHQLAGPQSCDQGCLLRNTWNIIG